MTWTLQWAFGGDAGIADDVNASWSESISLTRQTGNWRSASVVALLPIDMRTQRAHPRTGFAVLLWDGVERIRGRWKSPAFIPTSDGRARFEFDLSDSDEDDAGVWPPTSTQYPRQNPEAIVDYDITVGPRHRLGGGAGWSAGAWIETPVLSKDLFPDIAAPSEGAAWPYPIGAPGFGGANAAAPAWVFDVTLGKAGISGVPVSCTGVTLWGPKVTASTDVTSTIYLSASVPVYHEARSDGTAYAYVLLSDLPGTIDATPTNLFYWSTDTDATPSGAGDAVLSILAASTLAIDFAEWSRIADRLNRYRLDGFSEAKATPMAFARAQILPLLPVSVVPGPLGLRPVLWPWLDDTAARGIEVVDGIGVAVGDRVEYLDAQSVQAMTVRFGYDPRLGRSVLHTTANSGSTVYASLSSDALGTDEMEARLLWDRATAQLVTTDAMRWRSWSPRVLEIEIVDRARYGPGGTDDLYPGRRVVLTCDMLGVTSIAAMVGEREYDADTALVRVYLLDDPLTAV